MAVATRSLVLALLAVASSVGLSPTDAWAQSSAQATTASGTIVGQVTETGSGGPIVNVRVEAIAMPARRIVAAATTNRDGRYTMPRVPAGPYSVAVTRIGYSPRRIDAVQVDGGETVRVDIQLAVVLDPMITTVSRRPEKETQAPASGTVITAKEIARRPVMTPTQLARTVAGVDMTEGGLTQTNVVARGFNNAFSGSLLMLQDNRFASVPSLRVNIPTLMSSTSEDIERIEVVLGPGAALYGPNASSGVMHVITKSPFDSKGSTITLDGGERSVMRVGARHANTIGTRIGYKVSGEYMRGDDWQYRDPAEPATFPSTPSTPLARVGQPNARDFDVERAGGEARVDVRMNDGSELIGSYGVARVMSGLELTGANGTAQVRDWTMQHYQLRYRTGRLFMQAFGNLSNAGNTSGGDTDGTFLLRTGQPIVDYSRLGALQLQHGIDIGTRQSFLYGADYVFTNPRTMGTIHGRNEGDDNTTEFGGYVHSVTRFGPRWDLVTALRSDYNSRLDEAFVSPRATLVFKPSDRHNFRASYDRAYSTPGSFQMFLDLLQGSLRPSTGLPYDVRALGVPTDGFSFRRDCADGIASLCMRSPVPFANGTTQANAFTGAVGYQNALAIALQGGLQTQLQSAYRAQLIANGATPAQADAQSAALAAAVVTSLRSASPTSADVGSKLKLLTPGAADPFGTLYSADSVADIAPLKASFVNNFELGYKGRLGERLRIALDGWYQRRENFITAATNFTPTVFVDTVATRNYLTPRLTPILGPAGAQATATSVANALARIPAGNVVPDSRLTTNGDFAYTYRNIDQAIDVFGSDLAVDLQLTPRFAVAGTYSWVSDVQFSEVQSGPYPLSLNAPDHKASLTARWADDQKDYSAEVRGRYTNQFFVNSGVFVGQVPVNAFLDASFSWRLPIGDRRTTWGVNATNILNNQRASFVGVPEIGRLVMTRLQYTF